MPLLSGRAVRPLLATLAALAALAAPAAAQSPARDAALEWIDRHEREILDLADRIWDLAEPAFQEFQSAGLLRDTLAGAGFRVSEGAESLATDFVAEFGSGRPVIGILAEYDALPGLSQQRSPEHRPRPEHTLGHGCGHNLLGAGAVGGALGLRAAMARHRIPGTIRLYGTPAEEGGNGKVYMVREGLFDDVDAVLHWHPENRNRVVFESSLAVKSYRFRFTGLSAHAALNPDRGRSALDAVELMNHGVNALREHVPEQTRIHYVITEGGNRPNVVPDLAEVWYYIRSPQVPVLQEIAGRVENVARGAALMTGTEVEIRIAGGSWNLLPNRTLSEILQEELQAVGPPPFDRDDVSFARRLRGSLETDGVAFPDDRLVSDAVLPLAAGDGIHRASSDVGDVSWVVPTGGFGFAARLEGAPTHSWPFVATAGTGIGHKASLQAAKLFAVTGLALLQDPEVLAAAREEFESRRDGVRYRSIIPAGQAPPEKID